VAARKPVTKAERDAFIEDITAHPGKYRDEWDEQLRREHPEMTQAQMDNSWDQMAELMGFPTAAELDAEKAN
jgi:hypothetical protein